MNTKILVAALGILFISWANVGVAKDAPADGEEFYIDDGLSQGNLGDDGFIYRSYGRIEDYIDPEFSEGTRYKLRNDEVSDIVVWARNMRTRLIDMLKIAETKRLPEKEGHYLRGIKGILREAEKKYNELFIRYVLSRALVVHKMLSVEAVPPIRTTSDSQVGKADPFSIIDRVAILEESIHLAIDQYYESDLKYAQNPKDLYRKKEFAWFGVTYNRFIEGFRRSVMDASAQYLISRYELGLLQVDLARDLDKYSYARPIDIIQTQAYGLPERAPSVDQESIRLIRQINAIKAQLNIVLVDEVTEPCYYDGWDDACGGSGHRDYSHPRRGRHHDRASHEPRNTGDHSRMAVYRKMLGNKSKDSRIQAIHHLGEISGDEVTTVLIEMYTDDEKVADAAYSKVRNRSLNPSHIEQLVQMYDNGLSTEKRLLILFSLSTVNSDRSTTGLILGMTAKSNDVLYKAYNFLDERSFNESHVEQLGDILLKGDRFRRKKENRRLAAKLLGTTSSSRAYELLAEQFNREDNSDVLSAISSAMTSINHNRR